MGSFVHDVCHFTDVIGPKLAALASVGVAEATLGRSPAVGNVYS